MKMLDVPQSGSIAGVTSSRNRFGQYKRTRAIPVNPNSAKQALARSRFASMSEGWRGLTAVQREGWDSLGLSIQRTDALGQNYTLTGLQAYILVNTNNVDAGDAVVDDAPAIVSPVALLTLTPTVSGAAFSVAYTATPLGAGARAFLYVSPQRSAGRQFEADLRLLQVSAAAAASPIDAFAAYQARFGTPVAGNRIFTSVQVFQGGFLSAPILASAVVSA